MKGKNLVLGITGGIAVYKMPELISRLRKKGLNIDVVMTRAAAEFVTPLTFREVSQNQVHLEMFDENIQWNVEHVALAKKADLIAIVPATANVIGKIANGIADDLLTTTVMAATCPKLIAPAMNTGMYQNPLFQKNLQTLSEAGFQIIPPDSGVLLCGDTGVGKLAPLEELELEIEKGLSIPDLKGETVLVTAGGTREPIDPVRYLTNRSSGKMGHALAEAAYKRGAEVILVTAASLAVNTRSVRSFRVETSAEMYETVTRLAPESTIIIKAAAPADFRPESTAREKIKKNGSELDLHLVPTADILAQLGKEKKSQQLLVGFAAETNELQQHALAKLERKNLDLIIGNLVNRRETGMGADSNQVVIYSQTE
ncbi:MAG TPA: bifunctional phosphopantothenoylcysteine decarboxylase/phosphopantothenate--cysteine ligase CoaBC, partial [Bacillota bacterium]|nr:bifunctional phosphopantothenoylcysteine decarboxylase/phosphopantothenate--cysteine ligase CoaBC [Bacillota bacterium]